MMEKQDPQEKKNNRIGMITSLGFHALLFLLFFFLLAWSEPDPPIPEYGIELSFVSSTSTGKVENESEQQNTQESDEPEEQAEDPVEEVPEEVEQKAETSETSEVQEEVVEEVEETVAEPVEETETVETEDVNSPDVVETVKEEPKVKTEESTPKKVIAKEPVKKLDNNTDKNESEEKAEEKPAIDSRAIYTGSKGPKNSQSSSGGASLDLSGWLWDFEPEPNDTSDESGKIVFQIIVDNEGEIIGIKTLEKTVSPLVEKIYKDAVMELTFSKTAENRSVAPTSNGKITFIIQAR